MKLPFTARKPTFAAGFRLPLMLLVLGSLPLRLPAAVVFSTQFEPGEGYNPDAALVGQQNWQGLGNGTFWNGLLDGAIEGEGQQAYIGFFPADDLPDVASLWQPLNRDPVAENQARVTFDVWMAVVDSTTDFPNRDDFRWAVYNTDVELLFSLDFDNDTLGINYALNDGNGFVSTGETFENSVVYALRVVMDFADNRWSAWLGDRVLAAGQPTTTTGSKLTLGDIDAVWVPRDPNDVGDNYLLLDRYEVRMDPAGSPVPALTLLDFEPDGSLAARVAGQPGRSYAIEVTTDLSTWTSVLTNTPATGEFEFTDPASVTLPSRQYRVRLLP